MSLDLAAKFDNSYARLPARFFAALAPTPVERPALVRVNHALAARLDLDPAVLESDAGLAVLAGNRVPQGAEPLAAVYAGHQFGAWVPQLGDGRAILLGEVLDVDGVRYDIQLKGAGRTPYSRMGDGRSPLGPVLREYLVSESMAALGIPTTRALAAVTTGEQVLREQALPGGVLTRVARSHIRVGTFQYFAAHQDLEALRLLTAHVIERHYPEAGLSDRPTLALLEAVIAAQARLLARWQQVGFIHGVMNTDNMLLCADTIDYGPCAFMDAYDPDTVFSSIDRMGRYAYSNQPAIAHWNLACLAQCLLPLLAESEDLALASAQEAVDAFPDLFAAAYLDGLRAKLGLFEPREDDVELAQQLLELMRDAQADFTLSFRRLSELADPAAAGEPGIATLFELPPAFEPWCERWRRRCAAEAVDPSQRRRSMLATNPVFIARNHRVEEAIESAVEQADFAPFHRLVEVLSAPFAYDPGLVDFARPPRPEQRVKATFCGT